MILLFILVISLLQLILYYVFATYKISIPAYAILLLMLAGHYMLFPEFFYPIPDPDGINCGMPILGINLAFWIFGTIAALSTHLIWISTIK